MADAPKADPRASSRDPLKITRERFSFTKLESCPVLFSSEGEGESVLNSLDHLMPVFEFSIEALCTVGQLLYIFVSGIQ